MTFQSKAIEVPKPLKLESGKKIVFADYLRANHRIAYDIKSKRAQVISIIEFKVDQAGHTVFDLTSPLEKVLLNQQVVEVREIQLPKSDTQILLVDSLIEPGTHKLIVKSTMSDGLMFENSSVDHFFAFRDLRDRHFLERYLPANLEFDSYKIDIEVQLKGGEFAKHSIMTNGTVDLISQQTARVSFPESFNSSSLYFHIFPFDNYQVETVKHVKINGRTIDVSFYIERSLAWLIPTFKWRVLGGVANKGLLSSLERTIGPFPFDNLILKLSPNFHGGMEYVAAIETTHKALKHELVHMYFGRSVHPRDGQAGWVDEAIAMWYDFGVFYKWFLKAYSFFGIKAVEDHFQSKLKNIKLHSSGDTVRKTNKNSYKYGFYFIAYIDYLLAQNDQSLDTFLKWFFKTYEGQQITTTDFKDALEQYSNLSFENEFNKFIF